MRSEQTDLQRRRQVVAGNLHSPLGLQRAVSHAKLAQERAGVGGLYFGRFTRRPVMHRYQPTRVQLLRGLIDGAVGEQVAFLSARGREHHVGGSDKVDLLGGQRPGDVSQVANADSMV